MLQRVHVNELQPFVIAALASIHTLLFRDPVFDPQETHNTLHLDSIFASFCLFLPEFPSSASLATGLLGPELHAVGISHVAALIQEVIPNEHAKSSFHSQFYCVRLIVLTLAFVAQSSSIAISINLDSIFHASW